MHAQSASLLMPMCVNEVPLLKIFLRNFANISKVTGIFRFFGDPSCRLMPPRVRTTAGRSDQAIHLKFLATRNAEVS